MRRPHPYLAIALVCAAVVLVTLAMLACPVSAQAWSTTPVPRRTPTPTPAPSAQPTCLPLIHGAIVWPGSPECTAERGTDRLNVPTQERLGAIRAFTARVLSVDLASGALTTDASLFERTEALNQIANMAPVYYDRPLYGTWAATPPALPPNCGNAYCGCASGVGSWPPKIDVSQRLGRVEALVAWEYTNAVLGSLRRPDLWDNAYVSSVVSRVGQQIGGWSQ